MELPIIIQGIIIGVALAAPIGPISIISIRKSLTDRFLASIAVALGAATADAIFGLIAAFGVTTISSFLIHYQKFIRAIGGIFLAYLGAQTLQTTRIHATPTNKKQSLLTTYLSITVLTLTNPITILAFGALFTVFGLDELMTSTPAALQLVVGVFCGSAAWFIFLSAFIHFFKSRWKPGTLGLINRISGILLIIFGLLAVISTIKF